MTENAEKYKYGCSDYGIGFDARLAFSLSNCNELCTNVIIFGLNFGSSVHTKKDIWILQKGQADGLKDTTIRAGTDYSINITETIRETFFKSPLEQKQHFLVN